jgi:protein involved in temperature-dependent protein secretion
MVRIFFSGFTDDETLLSRLKESVTQEQENLAATQAILAEFQQRVENLPTSEQKRIGFFQLLTVERAILHHQAQIDWLTSISTRLENQDFTIAKK